MSFDADAGLWHCVRRRKVPPPQARRYDQSPEYSGLAKQPGRDRITVEHGLSTTLGLEWDELTIPFGDLHNSVAAMEAAPDRLRFVLERPIVGEPGAKWVYCGGATALLGRLIAKGTGEDLLAYARRILFGPLDFGLAEWTNGNDGEPELRQLRKSLTEQSRITHALVADIVLPRFV